MVYLPLKSLFVLLLIHRSFDDPCAPCWGSCANLLRIIPCARSLSLSHAPFSQQPCLKGGELKSVRVSVGGNTRTVRVRVTRKRSVWEKESATIRKQVRVRRERESARGWAKLQSNGRAMAIEGMALFRDGVLFEKPVFSCTFTRAPIGLVFSGSVCVRCVRLMLLQPVHQTNRTGNSQQQQQQQ